MIKSTNETGALIDESMMMVGKLVNNAAICDAILFSAFKIITGCEHKIAHAIYFASETFHSKRNIINRILKVSDDKGEKKIIQRIISATEKSQNQRSELSHALLRVSPDGQKILSHSPRRQSQAHKPVTYPYLESLLKNSSQAYLDAYRAFQELCQNRGIPPSINLE